MASVFNARLEAQANLIRKPEFDFKLKGVSDKVTLINPIIWLLKTS